MTEVRIEQVGPSVVAFREMKGPYSQMPVAFGDLYRWVGEHGLTPGGMPRGVYMTDPAVTPEDEAVWEVQAPVTGDPADAGADGSGCGVRRLDGHMEACTVHRGPYESIAPTYEALAGWVAEQGLALTGPPMEVYLTDPSEAEPEDYLTEVRFPVARVS